MSTPQRQENDQELLAPIADQPNNAQRANLAIVQNAYEGIDNSLSGNAQGNIKKEFQKAAITTSVPIARKRTPAQQLRAEKVYNLSVIDGLSFREISRRLKIALHTVLTDMRAEEEWRAKATAQEHVARVTEAAAQYDKFIVTGLYARGKYLEDREAGRKPAHVDALMVQNGIRAREMKDRVLGLYSSVRVDITVQALLESLLPPADS